MLGDMEALRLSMLSTKNTSAFKLVDLQECLMEIRNKLRNGPLGKTSKSKKASVIKRIGSSNLRKEKKMVSITTSFPTIILAMVINIELCLVLTKTNKLNDKCFFHFHLFS